MFPVGSFAHPTGSFKVPVAIPTTEPNAGSQVCVQFGRNWLPYVLGSLMQLLLEATWIHTTEDEIKSVQQSVFDLIAIFANAIDTGDCLVEPQFRQLDNCNLEVSFDGGATWSVIFNALNCALEGANAAIDTALADGTIAGIAQPAPITPPVPAACFNYHVVLNAAGKWFLPFAVDDGWSITIGNAKGGANDGSIGPLWECPEGTIYTLGACGADAGTHTGDPIDTINHMRLIMQYGSTFHDAYNQSFTIPTGTGSVNLVFQVNDTVLSDNNGSYEFDLEVCNNAAVGCPSGSDWSSTLDFTVSDYASLVTIDHASYVAGQGYVGVTLGPSDNGVCELEFATTAYTITQAAFTYSAAGGSGGEANVSMLYTATGGGFYAPYGSRDLPGSGTGLVKSVAITHANVTNFVASINGGDTVGSTVMTKIVFCGSGTKPPELP